MDLVPFHGVTAQIPNTFHLVRLVVNFDLIRFHRLLNLLANLGQSCIDSRSLDPCICCLFHCFEQIVVDGVESHSESTVGHQAANVRSIVNLHHIILTQDCLVANIGSPVSRAVIQTGARGECNARIQAICLDQASICGLNLIANVHDLHAWLDETLRVLASLAMNFRRTPQVVVVRFEDALFGPQLSICDSVSIMVIVVLLDFADREFSLLKLLADWNLGRIGLFVLAWTPTTQHSNVRVVLLSWCIICSLLLFLLVFLFLSLFSSFVFLTFFDLFISIVICGGSCGRL